MPPGRPPKNRDKSPSSTPVPTEQRDGPPLPDEQLEAMSNVLNAIYDYRTEDDFDPSKLFHRKPNKRYLPEYYETIKEPIAMSTIKHKIFTKAYRSFTEFVRDFALICHNAQVFNVPDSGAFQDALVIKEQLEKQLQILVNEGTITQEVATLPDLGEIPVYEQTAEEKTGDGGDEEDSDDEGEEDDEEEGDEDEERQKPRRRGRPPKGDTIEDVDGKRTRGRPPKLQTPLEARIAAILKGLRKIKDSNGRNLIRDFDRLPDKAAMPEYYSEIRNPLAYDGLKRKAKRKKYKTLEDFMADVNLIFNNAKSYNTDESQIYKDAITLQIEAGRLYDEERAKPDDSFADEEGKIPIPGGVLHNGELYKVGDWVHIQNANDLTKPIPAQIYRTYRDSNGQNMVNVCWYYRPEQTIHRYDKHFWENEVFKTGRYRDHRVEEIEGKCYIMFYTRYFKGRPRGFPAGGEAYVCQARYNEAQPQFNMIKTWASCLPDEVRDKDYEMELFDYPRKMKKYPSPIAYLLKDDQKETDDFPKAEWGADNAPPKIGAVHRRTRTGKDSPPPEPTPPPQERPTPALKMNNSMPPAYGASHDGRPSSSLGGPGQPAYTPARGPQFTTTAPTPDSTQHPSIQRAPSGARSYSPSAAARDVPGTPHMAHVARATTPQQRPNSAMQNSYTPMTGMSPGVPPQLSPHHSYTSANANVAPASMAPTPSFQRQPSLSSIAPPPPASINYRDPPPPEVYVLPDIANLSIPLEVRQKFSRDDQGRILFFTAPPSTALGEASLLGHSVRYRVEKERRRKEQEEGPRGRKREREADDVSGRARGDVEMIDVDDDEVTPAAVPLETSLIDKLRKEALEEFDRQLGQMPNIALTPTEEKLLAVRQNLAAQKSKELEARRRVKREERKFHFPKDPWGMDSILAGEDRVGV